MTKIQWTDATWNPIRGCSLVSAGCSNCYAMKQAHRFSGPGKAYEGLTRLTSNGPVWTGEVRFVDEHLEDPLRCKAPRRIFVNSMSDLFHESLPDQAIDRVFAVMALSPQHTFQILTKRAERMCAYLNHPGKAADIAVAVFKRFNVLREADVQSRRAVKTWPLKNVWPGVSVEDQKTADERIPWLLKTPAAVRWVSYEPALGPVDFGIGVGRKHGAEYHDKNGPCTCGTRLDWIVVGGESGPKARPFNLQWARDLIGQCKAAGVACFVKQVGARPIDHGHSLRPEDQSLSKRDARWVIRDSKGGDWSEWPDDLRIREFPEA